LISKNIAKIIKVFIILGAFSLFTVESTTSGTALAFSFHSSAQSSVDDDIFYREGNPHASLWQRLRQSFRLYPMHFHHPSIQKQILFFQKHKEYFQELTHRAIPYLYFVLNEVNKHNFPGEVALLPMLESSYNPFAHNPSGAAGMWQLMPETARDYGLKRNFWYDGRRDIIASTKAALSHLHYLNRFFQGNWLLAFAAYDSGEGTVKHATYEAEESAASVDSFWKLDLPHETQHYVPRLLALAAIIDNPSQYGMELPEVPDKPYFKSVQIDSSVALSKVAKLASIPLHDLFKLNPGFNHWSTGPQKQHALLLPVNNAENLNVQLMSGRSNTTPVIEEVDDEKTASTPSSQHDSQTHALKSKTSHSKKKHAKKKPVKRKKHKKAHRNTDE